MQLNAATMAIVVQHYFDTVLFASGKAPKVNSVRKSSKSSYEEGFEVDITTEPEKTLGEARLTALANR